MEDHLFKLLLKYILTKKNYNKKNTMCAHFYPKLNICGESEANNLSSTIEALQL